MSKNDGLSIGYRIRYGFRRLALALFGPATLGDNDPVQRLQRERADKVAQARAARARK